MSWIEHHALSERLAARAQAALHEDRRTEALELYAQAAREEERALENLDSSKKRTMGVSAVSAVSLYYKSGDFVRAEATAHKWLAEERLLAFAKKQLQALLQAIWSEQIRDQADLGFAPGQVLVSIDGGQILAGGAPLDLIVEKAKAVQSLFYRTAEFLSELPHRSRGAPNKSIQEICRPWLFQTAPGSYQFAVAIQESSQDEMFETAHPASRDISDWFLRILRASVDDPAGSLPDIVPDHKYRSTFLTLTRNLAPTGKTCKRLEIRWPSESHAVSLDSTTRKNIGHTIRSVKESEEPRMIRTEEIKGVLRALHLDKDWLELAVEGQLRRIHGVGEQVDDVVGPMVNKAVTVHVSMRGEKARFVDIEADD